MLNVDFFNYSACWRSNRVLVSIPDVTPLISGQYRVVVVSSLIAKIFNPSKCWTVTIQPFWIHSRLNLCSFLLFVASCVPLDSFVQYSYFLVNIQFLSWKCVIFRSCKQQSSAVNKHHTPDRTIFVLVQEQVAYYNHRHRRGYMEPIFSYGLGARQL
jgi:hypothetical protein